jgi:hypothetical protein
MIEALQGRVNGDAGLVRRGRYLTTSFLLEIGKTAFLISIYEGRIVSGLGHFPMSENPDVFLGHLLPVLEKIGRV